MPEAEPISPGEPTPTWASSEVVTPAEHRVHAAFKAMDLTVLDIPADAAMQLASLGARTGRRMPVPDCSVVRAAARTGGAVLTFDEKLRGSAADLGISGC